MKPTLKFVPNNDEPTPPEHKLPEGFEDFNDNTCMFFEEVEQHLKSFVTPAYTLDAHGEKVPVEGDTVFSVTPPPPEKKLTKFEQKVAKAVEAFDVDGEVLEPVMTSIVDSGSGAPLHIIQSEEDLPKVEPRYED